MSTERPKLQLVMGGRSPADGALPGTRKRGYFKWGMKSIRLQPDVHYRVKLLSRILEKDLNETIAWLFARGAPLKIQEVIEKAYEVNVAGRRPEGETEET